MGHTTMLFCILLCVFLAFSEAQFVEIPSDMRYHPCQMEGYRHLPLNKPEYIDARPKRQQKYDLVGKIESLRKVCAADLGIPIEKVPADLLNVENPSKKIKCVMACILQRLQLMTRNNLISVRGIERMADEIGEYNPLITSIAMALAEQFNERLAAMRITDQCEAAYLINRYIVSEAEKRKIPLVK